MYGSMCMQRTVRIALHLYTSQAQALVENLHEGVQHHKGKRQRELHTWPCVQLYSIVGSLVQKRGTRVECVASHSSSRTCRRCCHHRATRCSQHVFRARCCCYQLPPSFLQCIQAYSSQGCGLSYSEGERCLEGSLSKSHSSPLLVGEGEQDLPLKGF
jgi:hypothetical protein